MRKRNLISSIVLLALAIAIIMNAGTLSFGSLWAPEAGFFPFILGVLLAIFSLILLGKAMKGKREEESLFDMTFGRWGKMGLAVGALFAFTIFVEHLGYIISSFLLVAFLLRVVEPQKWWLVIVVAFFSSLVAYLVFGLWLDTPLPKGIFGL